MTSDIILEDNNVLRLEGETTVNGAATINGQAHINGSDLTLMDAGRKTDNGKNYRRALVHDYGSLPNKISEDKLTINYASDYPGGVKINGGNKGGVVVNGKNSVTVNADGPVSITTGPMGSIAVHAGDELSITSGDKIIIKSDAGTHVVGALMLEDEQIEPFKLKRSIFLSAGGLGAIRIKSELSRGESQVTIDADDIVFAEKENAIRVKQQLLALERRVALLENYVAALKAKVGISS